MSTRPELGSHAASAFGQARVGSQTRRLAWLAPLVSLSLLGKVSPAHAEGAADGERALPALGRVALADRGSTGRLSAAGTVGLGLTEAQGPADGVHERLSSRLALSAYATPWLAFGLLGDGRYDRHPADAGGVDDGWLFRSELTSRASAELGKLHLGVDIAAWVPGGTSVGSSFDALGLDTRLLLSRHAGSFTLGGQLGYRIDRSARAAGNTAALRHGDRIALGDSDFDAALVGLGSSYRFGATELYGEVSADLLLGRGAPTPSQSPIRVTTGARRAFGGNGLSAELMLDVLLSGRPDSGPTAPLVPIEPRATLSLGLRYRFGSHPAAPLPAAAPGTLSKPAAAKPEPPPEATLEITVTDEHGQPLANASVELIRERQRQPLEANGPGRYRLRGAPTGHARLRVHADGRQDVERELTLEPGRVLDLDVQSQPALPAGQVRGLVRSFRGKALFAKVRVEPVGLATTTDGEGFFQIDVPPGDYELVIEAQGYAAQRRKAHVDLQGVLIVNADLSQAP